MNDILLTFLGIIIGLVILSKLPVTFGYLLNTLEIKPNMDSRMDDAEKQQFDDEMRKIEKDAMQIFTGFHREFGNNIQFI